MAWETALAVPRPAPVWARRSWLASRRKDSRALLAGSHRRSAAWRARERAQLTIASWSTHARLARDRVADASQLDQAKSATVVSPVRLYWRAPTVARSAPG